MEKLSERYAGKMACCGKTDKGDDAPMGQRQPGDVLAAALWGGNRKERGRATGRRYPRTGNGKQVWVAPADINASPSLWQAVPHVERVSKDDDNVRQIPDVVTPSATDTSQLARAAVPVMRGTQNVVQQYKPNGGQERRIKPDVDAIIRMGREAMG
jgi:hypothetical protein